MTDPSGAAALEALHGAILDAWNQQDEQAYADCFTDDALVIGFDGSEIHGRAAIAEQLGAIFADHRVAKYVRVVRSVRRLDERTGLLHAVVGMIPPDGNDVMPDRHAVQLLVGVHEGSDRTRPRSRTLPPNCMADPKQLDALTEELRAERCRVDRPRCRYEQPNSVDGVAQCRGYRGWRYGPKCTATDVFSSGLLSAAMAEDRPGVEVSDERGTPTMPR